MAGPPRRWRFRRTRVVWVGDVLLVQSGLLRLGVTPVCAQIPREVSVESLEPSEVRGWGRGRWHSG